MLSINGITKSYGSSLALDEISLTVDEGEIVAVIGPNGAGKSTLFNILAGVLDADSGTAYVNDVLLRSLELKRIGFVSESLYFYKSFTPHQTVLFEQTMRDIVPSEIMAEELFGRFDVLSYQNKKMGNLSQGMAKRVALVCAFLGLPRVVILDEPLNGLDIQSVISLKEQLLFEKARGTHILISSHVLTFLDGLVDKTYFMNEGKIAFESKDDTALEEVYKQLFVIL